MAKTNTIAGRSGRVGAIAAVLATMLAAPPRARAEELSRAEVAGALRTAGRFFREEVASHGGYLWCYSGDLSLREGEGIADEDTVWVQPPGTPAVGEAFLDAYEATGETLHLTAARDAATALLLGQLHSGGWHYRIVFAPAERAAWAHRFDLDWRPRPDPVSARDRAGEQGWHVWRRRKYRSNMTILDDDTSQAALRFLMRLDRVLEFGDSRIHEAVLFGLESVLGVQYPNGAWSHNYDRFPGHRPAEARYPVKPASYPDDWPRTWPKRFAGCYMLNDGITSRAIETMLLAWDIYRQERFLDAALLGGDFLRLTQMPEPQPAWAQQYDPNMHPVWDRAFEPPAISGRESQTVLETLLLLHQRTGEQRFLDPIPHALGYLKRSRLPDGRLARFYELKTNRPLYFMRDRHGRHQLTYDSSQLPDHYAFIVDSRLGSIEAEYRRMTEGRQPPPPHPPTPQELQHIIKALDERGAWVEAGRLKHHKTAPESGVIASQTFINNVETLCAFLRAGQAGH